MSLNSITREMSSRARTELLANQELQVKLLAIYRQNPDRRGGGGVVRLLPKKSKGPACCPH